jgi:hypothetical protein
MYHTDFVCTYKKLLNGGSDDNDSESLYQAQFLQAFGCESGYDDTKIREGMKEVRQILESHSEGQAFLDEAFKQGLPPALAIFATIGGEEKSALIDTIIRTYYGWPTMDLMHSFVCKVKNADDSSLITRSDWVPVVEQHKTLYNE